jgi:hypothetical protein
MRLRQSQGSAQNNELSKDELCLELHHQVPSSHSLGQWSSTRALSPRRLLTRSAGNSDHYNGRSGAVSNGI